MRELLRDLKASLELWWPLAVLVMVCWVVGGLLPGADTCRQVNPSARARLDVSMLACALSDYAAANDGVYPCELDALVEPDGDGLRFIDRARVPFDPWGQPYVYVRPVVAGSEPSVMTLGRDKQAGGAGDDADIDSRSVLDPR